MKTGLLHLRFTKWRRVQTTCRHLFWLNEDRTTSTATFTKWRQIYFHHNEWREIDFHHAFYRRDCEIYFPPRCYSMRWDLLTPRCYSMRWDLLPPRCYSLKWDLLPPLCYKERPTSTRLAATFVTILPMKTHHTQKLTTFLQLAFNHWVQAMTIFFAVTLSANELGNCPSSFTRLSENGLGSVSSCLAPIPSEL